MKMFPVTENKQSKGKKRLNYSLWIFLRQVWGWGGGGNVNVTGEPQPLWWWLEGHSSADCLLGNEAVMFLMVMERLSSRWQQDMSVGMTHNQRRREAASTKWPWHNRLNMRSVGSGMRPRAIVWCPRGFIKVRLNNTRPQWLGNKCLQHICFTCLPGNELMKRQV